MNADPANAHLEILAVQALPQPETILPAGPKVSSRHRTITNDLYSYQGYKSWMNNAREKWKDT